VLRPVRQEGEEEGTGVRVFFYHFTALNVFVPCQNGATTVNNSLSSVPPSGGRARAHTYRDKKHCTNYTICRQSMGRKGQGGTPVYGRRSPPCIGIRHYYYYYVRAEFYGRVPTSVLSSSAPAISIKFFSFREPSSHRTLYPEVNYSVYH